jgi:hypothetical protein
MHNTLLMNFNIPRGLKADLDRIASHRNVSRTAIIITLIEEYCRRERKELEERSLIRNAVTICEPVTSPARSMESHPEPPAPIFSTLSRWEDSYDFSD